MTHGWVGCWAAGPGRCWVPVGSAAPPPCGRCGPAAPPPTCPALPCPALRCSALPLSPQYNKGLAFSQLERDRLYLRGLLPPAVLSQEVQAERVMTNIRSKQHPVEQHTYLMSLQVGEAAGAPPRRARCARPCTACRAWMALPRFSTHGAPCLVQERNERLFYYVLAHHIEELLPIMSQPTIGQYCQGYSLMFRRWAAARVASLWRQQWQAKQRASPPPSPPPPVLPPCCSPAPPVQPAAGHVPGAGGQGQRVLHP